jgi:RimJ/RimL family protein N-acetyltransferase
MGHLTSDDCSCGGITPTWPERLTLATGKQIAIRPLDSRDRRHLTDLFTRMSRQSRQRRFFSPKQELTERELTYFTDIDHVKHEALAAVDPSDGSFVGVARYVEFGERPRTADVSVEVADEQHSMGVATALVARLVERGRANGVEYLEATTKWENAPARALARRVGFRARSSRGGEIVLELSLGAQRAASGTR